MSTGLSPLLISIVALLGLIGAVPLLWWSLFGDRGSGRRRCPRCWHDLSGTPGMQCGECGHVAKQARELERTRRRLGVSMVAIVMSGVALGTLFWQVENVSWTYAVPNRALIWMLPAASSSRETLPRELASRMMRGELTADQQSALVDLCVLGDADARAPSPEWREKYLEFLQIHRATTSDVEAYEKRMLDLPVDVTVDGPASSPEETPICLLFNIENIVWPNWADVRATIAIRDESGIPIGPPTVVCRRIRFGRGFPFPIALPALEAGRHELRFDVALDRRTSQTDASWKPYGALALSHTVTVSGKPEVRPPIDSPTMTEDIRNVFRDGVISWESGVRPRRIRFAMEATSGEEWEGVAIGVRVELLFDGRPARISRLWWMGGPGGMRQAAWEPAIEKPELLTELNAEDDRWTVRIRGDRDLAYRVDDAGITSWWGGETSMPLKLMRQSGRSPALIWFHPTEDEPDDAVDAR